jgi:SET domain-containing protein
MVSLYPMKATVQATVRKTAKTALTASTAAPDLAPAPGTPVRGRRLQVRKSGVHGKGVFAVQPIRKGEAFIEYIGEVIDWPEALRRHPHDPDQPDHTFYFHLDDERVIDGLVGGNASRWINHACAPNCEAEDDTGRVWLKALRNIKVGEELFFDYGLVIEERYTPALKKRFECRCGAKTCRGTMLAPKRAAKA